MQNENTTVTKLGCFGMFSCYNILNETCMNCQLSRECAKIASERYEKLKDIIRLDNEDGGPK